MGKFHDARPVRAAVVPRHGRSRRQARPKRLAHSWNTEVPPRVGRRRRRIRQAPARKDQMDCIARCVSSYAWPALFHAMFPTVVHTLLVAMIMARSCPCRLPKRPSRQVLRGRLRCPLAASRRVWLEPPPARRQPPCRLAICEGPTRAPASRDVSEALRARRDQILPRARSRPRAR